MKPAPTKAMQRLIRDVRQAIPFDAPTSQICQKTCHGCPKKLLAYLESELEIWENPQPSDSTPKLGDIRRLARTSKKIYTVLKNNNLA